MAKILSSKVDNFGKKILGVAKGDSAKGSFHKFKASIFAILIGFIVGAIPILMVGGNVFVTYGELFMAPLRSFQINRTITIISVFILLGVGIGISFKTGLFNIGAPGQFLVAGAFTTMMGIQLNMERSLSIPLMILIAALSGALVAALAGIFKALFNVHEVVSTILLNWTFYYIVKWIFKMKQFKSPNSEASLFVKDNMRFDISLTSVEPWVIFMIAIVVVVMIWFVFKFTTFGFKMRANGLSKTGSEYAGINTKVTTILSMSLSGAVIGVAGFIYYSTYQGQMPHLSTLPTIGFEAITVALLAFSSPLGCLIAGGFYGLVYRGIPSAAVIGNVPGETIDLVLGLIVFFAALAPLLIKFKPVLMAKIKAFELKSSALIELKSEMKKTINDLKAKEASRVKEVSESRKTQETRYKEIILEYKNDKEKIRELVFEEKLSIYMKRILQNEWHAETQVVSSQFKKKEIDLLERDLLLKKINLKYKNIFKDNKLNDANEQKQLYKISIKSEKNNYKMAVQEAWEAHALKPSIKGGK